MEFVRVKFQFANMDEFSLKLITKLIYRITYYLIDLVWFFFFFDLVSYAYNFIYG